MEKGFITLDRRILDWEWFTDGNMLKLWIYLLESANYEDTYYRGRLVKRGQLLTGRKELSQRLKMSEQSVRTCINRLKSTKEITTESTNKDTLITILKYKEYQDRRKKSTNKTTIQPTNEQPTTNQQLTTSKEINEIKEIKEYILIPPTIDEVKAYCEERKNGVDYKRFYDYYSVGGWKDSRGKPIKNWKQKMIANWEKNVPESREEPISYDDKNNRKLSKTELEDLLALRGA